MGLTSKNIVFLLVTTLLFILLSLPYTYNLTTDILKPINFSTIVGNGCPNIMGILLHSVVFLIVIFILFLALRDKETYFRGLANPGRMKMCNGAQLVAKRFKNKDCAKAAESCVKHPGQYDCHKNLEICNKKSSPVQKYVNDKCSDLLGSLP